MKLRGGYTNYGETIGILLLDTRFPRPRGDIGNALSLATPARRPNILPARGDREKWTQLCA
jgi:hypothetical protein